LTICFEKTINCEVYPSVEHSNSPLSLLNRTLSYTFSPTSNSSAMLTFHTFQPFLPTFWFQVISFHNHIHFTRLHTFSPYTDYLCFCHQRKLASNKQLKFHRRTASLLKDIFALFKFKGFNKPLIELNGIARMQSSNELKMNL
jgi:hypothetical protein